ncbi:MAG: Flp family type IVb pilin [Acidobacteriota bacterium]
MSLATTRLLDLLREESGQDLVEYGLILAVMALALVASMTRLTSTIGNFFNNVGNTF